MLVLQGKVVLVKLLEFWCGVGYPFEGVIDKFPAAIVGGNPPLLFTEDHLIVPDAGAVPAIFTGGLNVRSKELWSKHIPFPSSNQWFPWRLNGGAAKSPLF